MKGTVTMATKHIFIINPMAGKGKAVLELEDALKPFGAGYDIEVYRTTGAGDAFCAGVSVGLTYGKTLEEAIGIGSLLAASVISSSENVCPRFLPEELGLDVKR